MSFSSIKKPPKPQDIVPFTPQEHLNYVKQCVIKLAGRGYQTIPLAFGSKKPVLSKWSEIPTVTPENCLVNFNPKTYVGFAKKVCALGGSERVNLGLLLGRPLPNPLSGTLFAVDMDDPNPEHGDLILNMFRDAPGQLVVRKGTKGFQFYVRVLAEEIQNRPSSKSKHKVPVELLGPGRQSVLPPSVYIDDSYWTREKGEEEPDELEINYIYEDSPESVHFFQWTTVPLWDVESDSLPLLSWNKWKEIEIFRQMPTSKLFTLHKTIYLGEGKGGGYHEAALQTLASYYAHNFPKDYILERFQQLSRQACRVGGCEQEFLDQWDVEKEVEALWEQTEGKFKSGDWKLETFVSVGEKLDKEVAIATDNRKVGAGKKGRKDVLTRDDAGRPKFQLVRKDDFDEYEYAHLTAEVMGGFGNLCKVYDPSTKSRDPEYVYWYVEKDNSLLSLADKSFASGYWQQININARNSWLCDLVATHFGITRPMADATMDTLLRMTPARSKYELYADKKRYIKLRNGTFDLDTLALVPDSKDHFLTHMIDVEYDPFAKSPKYDEFMKTVFYQVKTEEYDYRTDEQLQKDCDISINAYEEFLANTLIEDDDFQRSLILRGEPNSGKSKAMELVTFFHPEVSRLSWSEMDNINARARLFDVLVNLTDEVDRYEKINAALFKRLIGGTGVTYKTLYKDIKDGKPKCRFIFAFNDFPRTIEINNSIERRMLILSCNNIIPADIRDFKILQKLEAEKSGIFNRWVAALQRLRDRGDFEVPMSHSIEIDAFRNHNDVLGDFFRERCELHKGFCSFDDLFRAFRTFAEDCGHRFPYTKQSFRSRFRKEAAVRKIDQKVGRVGTSSARGYAITLTGGGSEF